MLLWSLIKTLVDGSYKINNTWLGFSLSLKRICITGTQSNHCPKGSLSTTSPTFYFNLPYIGHFSVITQKKIRYYNHLDIKLVFSSFNIGNVFHVKDPIPGSLSSGEVYKFEYVGCNANYVGETCGIFPRVWRSIWPVKESLTLSNICKILNTVAPCVQQIAFIFWISPQPVFHWRLKRLFILRKNNPLCINNYTKLI